ncbi:hypothetical protein V8F33_008580 [Rhypophila sp. PSN 637]
MATASLLVTFMRPLSMGAGQPFLFFLFGMDVCGSRSRSLFNVLWFANSPLFTAHRLSRYGLHTAVPQRPSYSSPTGSTARFFFRRNSPGAAELVRPYVTNRPKGMNGQNARIFTILHNNNASTYLDALTIRHHVAHSISDSMHGCTTDVPNPVVVEAVRRSGLITDSQHKVQSPFAHAVTVQTCDLSTIDPTWWDHDRG